MDKKTLTAASRYIASWLALRHKNSRVPGMQVAVMKDGELLLSQAYGLANVADKEQLTTEHLFRIASHSKTFTATALLQLAEQGKLHMDDPVSKYVPWIRDHADPRMHDITIRQLASHGAGFIRDGLDADYWQLRRPFPDEAAFKAEVLAGGLILNPDKKMKYSNFGYGLLGTVVTQVSGTPYNEYVTDSIVKPLGLKNTGPEYTGAIDKRLATGYGRELDKLSRPSIAKAVDTGVLAAATGFYSTAADLCTYFNAHIVGSKKLLSDTSKREMQKAHWRVKGGKEKREYGLGLELAYVDDHFQFGHGGGFPGFTTKSLCDPETGLTVVVLANCIGPMASQTVRGVFSTLYYFAKHYKTDGQNLSKFEGRFMSLYDTFDFVSFGDKLVAVQADTPFPFAETEDLTPLDEHTLKINRPYTSLDSEGEHVVYAFGKKGIVSIRYAGFTMYPEETFMTKHAKAKVIHYAT